MPTVECFLNPLMVRYLKITRIGETAQRRQFSKIDDRVSLRRLLNLTITAVHPFERMIHCASPNHVEVDVNQAAMQVFVGLDRRGVIMILPKRPCRFLRSLYSYAVRPAMSCILCAIASPAVSFTSRCT